MKEKIERYTRKLEGLSTEELSRSAERLVFFQRRNEAALIAVPRKTSPVKVSTEEKKRPDGRAPAAGSRYIPSSCSQPHRNSGRNS